MAYQNKQWSMASVVGAAALLSVSVGVTIGLVASNSAHAGLYAPVATTTRAQVGTAAAVPVSQYAVRTQQASMVEQAAMPEDVDAAEYQMTMESQPSSFNWAPVAALIALPAALAAFLLRKGERQETELPLVNQVKLATAGVAASAMLAAGSAMPAYATDISGLTPCAESKKFQKNLKKEIKNIEKREKLYEEGSAPYLALEATKARTNKRFEAYGKAGLLCGADGLPHLISDPGLAVRYGHAGETFIPTFGFLYVAGYIGTAGRTYLQEVRGRAKPTDSEIIIDVPLATSIAFKSWSWPAKAFQEWNDGTLLEKDENVTRSPR